MAQIYEVFQPASQAPYQQRTYGAAWGAAFGEIKDQLMAMMKLGVMARLPMFAPIDALGEIGAERGIFQGIGESLTSYISRLINAWGEWSIGGTYWGILAELYGAGYSTAYIIAANGYVYGPSSGVTPPNPLASVAGNPPSYSRLPFYYASGTDYYVPWTFSSGDGQGTTGYIVPQYPTAGGAPDPMGAFWNRFVVMFDPVPSSTPTDWDDIVAPPTAVTAPSSGEIGLIQDIIARWRPGKTECCGILAITASCIGWPLNTTTHITFSCWLSRAILTGDSPTSTAFVQTHPQAVYSWLPHTAVANAGGSTYIFTTPSSYSLNGYLYSSPASSGTTGLVEPTWPTTLGNTVSDNGITWTCIATLAEFQTNNGVTCFQA
jgi:hypothetical protein